ncbi:MAG: hypothetical protein ACREDP_09615 [Bradyrhizobium sp.]
MSADVEGYRGPIAKCIERKQGNRDFALHGPPWADDPWLAMIGRPVIDMKQDHADCEYCGRGYDISEAVERVLAELDKASQAKAEG